jgi:hypothetical protein
MLGMVELLLYWTSLVKSHRRLEVDNIVHRHQVSIHRQRASRRLRLSNADRLAFVWLYRLCPKRRQERSNVPDEPSQSSTASLRNYATGIAATVLFAVPTIGFKLLHCLLVLAHGRRELVRHAVTRIRLPSGR